MTTVEAPLTETNQEPKMQETKPLEVWTKSAECRDLDPMVMWPEGRAATIEAKRVCNRCPVKLDCLHHSIDAKEKGGIWGGKNESERREYEHELRMAARKRRALDRDMGSEEDL